MLTHTLSLSKVCRYVMGVYKSKVLVSWFKSKETRGNSYKTFLNRCRYISKSRLLIDKFITTIQKWLQHWHLIWKKTYCAADGGRLARTCWAPAFEISLWTAAVSAVRATPCVENNIRIIIKLNNSSSLTTLFTSKFIQDKQRWPNFLMFVNPPLSLNFCLLWRAPYILLRTDITQSPTLPPASCQCVHKFSKF